MREGGPARAGFGPDARDEGRRDKPEHLGVSGRAACVRACVCMLVYFFNLESVLEVLKG